MTSNNLAAWHRVIEAADVEGLEALLADDAVFHSPVVHTPQVGKPIVLLYLKAAFEVLGSDDFRYVREVEAGNDTILEFETEIDGIHFNGVDMIRWNDDGKITDFKVMVRPLKAINLLHQKMAEMLQAFSEQRTGTP